MASHERPLNVYTRRGRALLKSVKSEIGRKKKKKKKKKYRGNLTCIANPTAVRDDCASLPRLQARNKPKVVQKSVNIQELKVLRILCLTFPKECVFGDLNLGKFERLYNWNCCYNVLRGGRRHDASIDWRYCRQLRVRGRWSRDSNAKDRQKMREHFDTFILKLLTQKAT